MPRAARRTGRPAGAVWAVAVAAYVVAVLHRTSFGVAGVEAVDRLGAGAAVLSTFLMVQLAVYAALQVPMGILLDRWGPRALVVCGAALMGVGQLVLAHAGTVGSTYLARVLIGAGDAATFISVLRLVAAWYPTSRIPLRTQLTGLLGQLGQVLAVVPFAAALRAWGWQDAFVGLAAVGLLAGVLVWVVVRDSPEPVPRAARSGLLAPLRAVARTPGTWLGFWTHAVTQFSGTVFVLLWGFPFLTVAQGLPASLAGLLLTLNVLAAMTAGPVVGVLTARHPLRRSWMVLAIAAAVALVWAAVLLPDRPSPLWVLAVFVVVLGVGGPGSAIGFDYARTSNPPARLGTATGLVNVGGFGAAVLSVLVVGLVLDVAAARGAAPLSLEAFRPAFAALAVPWLVALVGVLVTRRRTRHVMRLHGVVVPPLSEVVARWRPPRRRPSDR